MQSSLICVICGNLVTGKGQTCSRSCGAKLAHRRGVGGFFKKGNKPTNYNGGRAIHSKGYIYLLKPDHPNATQKGYVMEHRLVMENKIGRLLKDFEEVHHRNGIKSDNRIENLELVTNRTHNGLIECPNCYTMITVK